MTNRRVNLDDVRNPRPGKLIEALNKHYTNRLSDKPTCGEVRFGPDGLIPIYIGVYEDLCSDQLLERLGARREVVFYIHGFNNTLYDALIAGLTVQDTLGLHRQVILWSWPSAGSPCDYAGDVHKAFNSQGTFASFAGQIGERLFEGREKMSMVAHSLGATIADAFLEKHFSRRDRTFPLGMVMFAAPNMDPQKLRSTLNNSKKLLFESTLYACADDVVLGFTAPSDTLAGLGGFANIFIHKKVDSIDVRCDPNYHDTHSYFLKEEEVRADFRGAMDGVQPALRGLKKRRKDGFRYWVLPLQKKALPSPQ